LLLVAMIDLDKFKLLNESYGDIAGDQALVSVGWAPRQASTTAIIGRFNGEEFIVIDALPHDTARALPSRLCAAIAESPHPVTASVGAAVVRWSGVADPAAAIEALTRAADTAMYTAKRNGGNQIQFCTTVLIQHPHSLAAVGVRTVQGIGR
jgi:diguanylate cyclase (GGDEF)-like protein